MDYSLNKISRVIVLSFCDLLSKYSIKNKRTIIIIIVSSFARKDKKKGRGVLNRRKSRVGS